MTGTVMFHSVVPAIISCCCLLTDLNGSLPSECMMAVWVLSVAASLYILLHTGQGRGSWKASFLCPSLG